MTSNSTCGLFFRDDPGTKGAAPLDQKLALNLVLQNLTSSTPQHWKEYTLMVRLAGESF